MATTTDLKETLSAKDKPKTFAGMLRAFAPEIQLALPAHMKQNVDRYMRLAVTCFKQNPKLAECDPRSVFGSIIMSTQLGLELGVMGQAWLVPYKGQCQLIPGWLGYMDLLHRNDRASAWTGAVFEGDEFDYRLGDSPFVNHKPGGEDDAVKMTYVYAVGRKKGHEFPVVDVWTAGKCRRHRDRFNKVGQRHYSYENWEMYCRKVVLLQVLKYLPRSVEIAMAAQLDAAADLGAPGPTIEEAIDGSFQVMPTGEMTQEERDAALAREKAEAEGKP